MIEPWSSTLRLTRRPRIPHAAAADHDRKTQRQVSVAGASVLPDGDRFVVVGSNGGGPKDPVWVWNVRANGSAGVHVNRRAIPVSAHVSEGAEYERLFALLTSKGDSFTRYQERASQFGRSVPLVLLEPRG